MEQGTERPDYEMENPRLGFVGMGNHNPRSKSEAAPDVSIVMRAYRPANIRLIIVAVAEFGSLFCSLAITRKNIWIKPNSVFRT
jgi:hypothetical protein